MLARLTIAIVCGTTLAGYAIAGLASHDIHLIVAATLGLSGQLAAFAAVKEITRKEAPRGDQR